MGTIVISTNSTNGAISVLTNPAIKFISHPHLMPSRFLFSICNKKLFKVKEPAEMEMQMEALPS